MLERDHVRAETQENAIISWGSLVGSKSGAEGAQKKKNWHFGGLIFDFLHKIDVIFISFRKNPTKMFQVVVHNAATIKNDV